MKPVFQTTFGNKGDCWPACLASLLEVPLEQVAHLANHFPDWSERTAKYLAKRGLFTLEIEVIYRDGKIYFPFVSPPENQLCIVTGCFKNSTLAHAVVCRVIHGKDYGETRDISFNVIHDPLGNIQSFERTNQIIFLAKIYKQ